MRKLDQEKYQILYEEFMKFSEETHERNKKWIGIGLKCLAIIPILFLILMFTVTSNKAAFLILWILSVLLITSILIGIEFTDYKLQRKINDFRGEETEIDALTGDTLVEVEKRARRIQNNLDELFRIPEAATQEDEEGENS